eukprot:11454519-Alexandrium_andersonii.AAC.1
MGDICHAAPFGNLGALLRPEELMPGADARASEAVELQMNPLLPFDDRGDERRKARGRVGNPPQYDTLFVFDARQVLESAVARKNVRRVRATRERIPLQYLTQ